MVDNETHGKRQPYVRYRVSADTRTKGIGFAIERALKTYLDNHKCEAAINVIDRTNDTFEAVINLFDNGNYDFNMRALMEHLGKSGRMPSDKHLMPTIEIKPLSCNESVSISPVSKDDSQWVKTIEDLQGRLADSDKTISNLTDALGQRQKVIDEKHVKINQLTEVLQGVKPGNYDDPFKALLYSYVASNDRLSLIDEAAGELEVLVKNGDIRLFSFSRDIASGSYFDYINNKFGVSVNSDDELEKWIDESKSYATWEETPSGVLYLTQQNQFSAEENLYRLAKEQNVSEEVLSALNAVLDKKRVSNNGILNQIEEGKKDFARRRGLIPLIENARKPYHDFREIAESSKNRAEISLEFPLVFAFHRKPSHLLSLHVPSSKPRSAFLDYMLNISNDIVSANGYSFGKPTFDTQGILSVPFISKKSENDLGALKELPYRLRTGNSSILVDPMLPSMGIIPRVIEISD